MKRYFFVVLLLAASLLPVPLHDGGCARSGHIRAFGGEAAVCVTKKGKKYHAAGCRVIKDSQVEKLSRTEAENRGYTPCKICKP